jgi:cathepsin L
MVQTGLHTQTNAALVTSSFDDSVAKFGRDYKLGSDEYALRRSRFQHYVEKINKQNSKPDRFWTAGLNSLTDRTEDEFRGLLGWTGRGRQSTAGGTSLFGSVGKPASNVSRGTPTSKDWTSLSSMKTAKDQSACGSCWAVATASMLEGRYEVKSAETRSFSVQELVDCVPNPDECGGQGGCQGATVELAMAYVKSHGLSTEEDKPYSGFDQKCSSKLLQKDSGAKINGHSVSWKTLPSNKAGPLIEALQSGPVAVSAAASDWSFYSSGVFDDCTGNSGWIVNHAVLMVGYGKDGGKDYWKIKNSWGADWGENSYMRILKKPTVEAEDKNCGTDIAPEDGVECKPYPKEVEVCGHCGLTYDSVLANFD